MLILASVHVHTQYEDSGSSCYACIHHVHHDGHLTSSTLSLAHCVLCHFLAFNYLQAAEFVAVFFTALLVTDLCFKAGRLYHARQRALVPRGPPAAAHPFA